MKGDLVQPREAATRRDEGDSLGVWVGARDEEVGRGWRTGVDELGTACQE